MSLRSLKQYLELYHLNGIADFFIDSNEFKIDVKLIEENAEVIPDNNNCSFNNYDSSLDIKTTDLNLLKTKYSNCKKCSYHKSRIKFVYGEGKQSSDCFIIGNPPNSEENLTGRPFVGKPGQLFIKMIQAINLERQNLYITNITKCKTKNTDKTEIKKCLPYLHQQLTIVKPKIILIFGELAANIFLNTDEKIENLREKQNFSYNGIPVYITYTPTELLENQDFKKPAWIDLQKFRDHYQSLTNSF